jgi:hypothetical protein
MNKSFDVKSVAQRMIQQAAETEPSEVQEKTQTKPASIAEPPSDLPKGYMYKKVPTETRTARTQLLFTPTFKKRLKKRAKKEGVSVNALIETVLNDYMESKGD